MTGVRLLLPIAPIIGVLALGGCFEPVDPAGAPRGPDASASSFDAGPWEGDSGHPAADAGPWDAGGDSRDAGAWEATAWEAGAGGPARTAGRADRAKRSSASSPMVSSTPASRYQRSKWSRDWSSGISANKIS